ASLTARRIRRLGLIMRLTTEEMLVECMSYSEAVGRERLALLAPAARGEQAASGLPGAMVRRLGESAGRHPVTRLLGLDVGGFVRDLNLNFSDKMAMQSGVETRVPLLDPRIVSFAMQVPIRQKIDLTETKKILRRSQHGRLPKPVLDRPKQGLGVPVRAWLAG